ncbi:hypothetical protein V1460_09055 [Streptomyces sp. SCSIO 30461]|uniref:hypothetical protein n=1 Tax=Streptomyces sp. SCSIO 30461 TaxID=3118085 RepID=UPI0030D622B5
MAAVADSAVGRWLAGFLEQPVVGMAPWILFAVLSGPGRFEIAVLISLGISIVFVVLGRLLHPGTSFKILEVADVVFFAVLAIIGATASEGTHQWLETYADEVANVALAVIAFGSMAARVPFTVQYAREQVDRQYWDTPAFMRTNYLITAVWGLIFLTAAVSGGVGDLVIREPDNIWTSWIVPILAIIIAIRFTEWYPDRVRARARGSDDLPTASGFLFPLVGLLIPVGIVVLIVEDTMWLGIALIVIGVLGARVLKPDSDEEGAKRPVG